MSISKAFMELGEAEQFVFAEAFTNPQVMPVMEKVIAWYKEQLATLDPDSADFVSDYRGIKASIANLTELLNLSKQEKYHVDSSIPTNAE